MERFPPPPIPTVRVSRVKDSPLPDDPRVREEYENLIKTVSEFLALPDTYHFLNFIDSRASIGPVKTPAASVYRELRNAVDRSKHFL